MTVTKDDFNKIWGSTSSVPQYTFTDSDYQDGWEFVGNIPPTRAMWDELQRKNDEKMQYLSSPALTSKIIDGIDLLRTTFMCVKQFGGYTATQGMCVAGDYLIVSMYENTETDGRLYVIDIENKSVSSYVDGVSGHLNSLCYDANSKLVCVVDGMTIHRYALSSGNLSFSDDVTLSDSFQSATAIAWNNGLYYVRHGFAVFVSSDLSVVTKTVYVQEGADTGLTRQGMEVDDDYIYMPYSGSDGVERIHIYDKEDGKLLKVLTIPRGTFGELEEVAIYGGYMFLNFNRPFSGSMLGIYKIPLYKSTPNELDSVRANYIYQQNSVMGSFVVDSTNDIVFPDGTSDNPFNMIQEALILSQLSNATVSIVLKGAYTTISLRNIGKMVEVNFADATVETISVYTSVARLLNVNAKQITAELSLVNIDQGTLDGNNDTANAIVNYRSLIVGRLTTVQNYTGSLINGIDGWTNLGINTITTSNAILNLRDGRNNGVVNGVVYKSNSCPIVANADLNGLIDINLEYYCPLASVASSLSNCPSSKAFFMRVYKRHGDGWIMQQITDFDGNIYTRGQLTDGTWSVWHTITAS